MTRDEVLAMEPCRRSNWIVHMVVMGNKAWKFKTRHDGRYYTNIKFWPEEPTWPHNRNYTNVELHEIVEGKMIVQDVPDYFGFIPAAWEVVEKLNKEVTVKKYEVMSGWRYWCRVNGADVNRFDEKIVNGSSAPEVICKAALLTVLDL